MKKIFLFLTVLTFGLTMTSCLNSGSQNFVETSIVYIDNHGLTAYGKTLSGRAIINEKLNLMTPKTFKIISYSWDEEYGTKNISDMLAYNVVISGEADLNKAYLEPRALDPDYRGTPFIEIKEPAYNRDGFWFDDNWLFEYAYKGKKGEKPSLSFYMREPSESNPNLIEIDIRLNLSGTPEGGAVEQNYRDVTSIDMGYIRNRFLSSSNKEVSIKFYYYNSEEGELISSQKTYAMEYANK